MEASGEFALHRSLWCATVSKSLMLVPGSGQSQGMLGNSVSLAGPSFPLPGSARGPWTLSWNPSERNKELPHLVIVRLHCPSPLGRYSARTEQLPSARLPKKLQRPESRVQVVIFTMENNCNRDASCGHPGDHQQQKPAKHLPPPQPPPPPTSMATTNPGNISSTLSSLLHD